MHEGRLAWASSILWVAGQLCGCHAQVEARAETTGAESDDRRWEPPESATAAEAPAPRSASAAEPPGSGEPKTSQPSASANLAVVRDLELAPAAPRTAVCRCLALAYGSADDARFAWRSERPPGDALAIAITGEGVPCTAGRGALRHASIAGVGREGDDVVLTVEGVREGVPIVRGALVTRPPAGARLVVRARGAVPYGLAAAEAAPCRVELR